MADEGDVDFVDVIESPLYLLDRGYLPMLCAYRVALSSELRGRGLLYDSRDI